MFFVPILKFCLMVLGEEVSKFEPKLIILMNRDRTRLSLSWSLFHAGEYGGPKEALKAGDHKAVFVLAEPEKIPRHNFYEFVWFLKTGLSRFVSSFAYVPQVSYMT